MVRATHPTGPPQASGAGPCRRLPPLQIVQRKSDVLKPSSLHCLGRSYDAAINVTAGCPHRCTYCYARGYSRYPGDDTVQLYGNLVEKLRDELARRRRLPESVYFSSSCDAFAPYRQVQQVTYELMRMLLGRGVRVCFLTKGYIHRPFYWLFRQYPGLVFPQIGISTLHPRIARWLEPLAASPRRRLRNVARLMRIGMDVTVRVDPMVPFVTDTPEQLTVLCRRLAGMGVREAAASYLFLRPRLIHPFISSLPGPSLRGRLFDLYKCGVTVPLHGDGFDIRLPAAKYRAMGYERFRRIASRFGIDLRICTCKNADLPLQECCHAAPTAADASISPVHARSRRTASDPEQMILFDG